MASREGVLLPPSSFLLGLFSLLAQTIMLRELFVVFYGSEMTIGIVLASWLLWVGAGSLVGGRIVAALPAGPARRRILPGLYSAAAVLLPLSVLLVRAARLLVPLPPGEFLSLRLTILFSLALLAPTAFPCGLWFTTAASLPRDGVGGPGRTYAWEAAGGLLGGALFSFLLADRMEGLRLAAVLSLLVTAAACLLGAGSRPGALRRIGAAAACAAAVAAALSPAGRGPLSALERRSKSWRWPGGELVDTAESRYGDLALTRVGGQMTLFENGSPSFSFPDRPAAAGAVHIPLLAASSPKSVLVVGGGSGGILGELLRYPLERIDAVELDPASLRLTAPHLPPGLARDLRDRRVRVVHRDGRAWLRGGRDRYDVILLNLPPPSTAMVNRFYTREFFELARENLTGEGLLAFSLPASPNYYGEALRLRNGSVFQTLGEVFPAVAVLPAGADLFLATARPGGLHPTAREMREKAARLGVDDGALVTALVETSLDGERLLFARAQLAAPGPAPNRDLSPAAYFYHALFRSGLSDPGVAPWLRRLLGPARFLPFLLPLAVLATGLAAGAAGRGPSRRSVPLGLASFTTGWGAMAHQYLILFFFQTLNGHLYREIGFLNGAFMAGVAGGGFLSLRRAKAGDPGQLLLLTEGALLLWPFLLGAALQLFMAGAAGGGGTAAFGLLAALSGGLVGFQFPLFVPVHGGEGGAAAGGLGGRYYFCDLAGSAAGLLIVTLWVLPLLGLWPALLLGVSLKSASWAALLVLRGISRGRERPGR